MDWELGLDRLREAVMRLAAELDGARLYQAAAYISMAGDAILRRAQDDRLRSQGDGGAQTDVVRQAQGERPGGGPEPPAVDLDFTLDEQDRVWMIREGDCHILGGAEAVCAEMRRFLAGVAAGGDGYA